MQVDYASWTSKKAYDHVNWSYMLNIKTNGILQQVAEMGRSMHQHS